MDEQKKNCRRSLRDVEQLSLFSKEAQESIKGSLQHQLQEVEKRRHDLMLEQKKAQKRSEKYRVFRIRERICRERVQQRKRRCEGSERRSVAMRSAFDSSRKDR